MEVSPTVKVTETGYHDDMQLRGFAYNGNKVYYNPVIFCGMNRIVIGLRHSQYVTEHFI